MGRARLGLERELLPAAALGRHLDASKELEVPLGVRAKHNVIPARDGLVAVQIHVGRVIWSRAVSNPAEGGSLHVRDGGGGKEKSGGARDAHVEPVQVSQSVVAPCSTM